MKRRRYGTEALYPMPEKFNALARYNAEVSRGIAHTLAWQAAMAELQVEFDAWQIEQLHRCGAYRVLSGKD